MKKALEKASAEMENSGEKSFEKVLEKSMAVEESKTKSTERVERVPDRRSIVVPAKANQRSTVVESAEPVKIDSRRSVDRSDRRPAVDNSSTKDTNKNNDRVSDSIKIKNMLLEGKSVEEIARETGLGRGAVELVQEMTRRQLERK